MRSLLLVALILFLCSITVATEQTLLIDDFEHGLSPDWSIRLFKGETDYQVVADDASRVLDASSNSSASALINQKVFSLDDYPVISWRWKVDGTIKDGDATQKHSDDYAARLYIVFPHWFFPKTRSLNYIWANKVTKGEIVPSPYTTNSMMLAVESGPDRVGIWQTTRRNIVDDYRQAFGTNPPDKFQVAIMTDSDNTGGKARAWYDDILLERK